MSDRTITRKRKMQAIERRIKFLSDRILARPDNPGTNYDCVERKALEWALSECETAQRLRQAMNLKEEHDDETQAYEA